MKIEEINYLSDAMDIEFNEAKQYKKCDKSKPCLIKTTICGKCYKDPDAKSKKLYTDLSKLYKETNKVSNSSKLYLYFNTDKKRHLSSDYIGPSRYWAETLLKRDNSKEMKIGEFLLECRKIGGHVFWPAHQINKEKTINQIKGGEPIYDRIDITLAELKNYLNDDSKNPLYYKELYNAFERYNWFFKKINDIVTGNIDETSKTDSNKESSKTESKKGYFESFIQYMHLSMFIFEDTSEYSGEVKDLSQKEEKPLIPPPTLPISNCKINEQYIAKCTELIKIRTKALLNIEV